MKKPNKTANPQLISRGTTWLTMLLCLILPLQPVLAGELTLYYTDASGNPVVATDIDGTILWREHYQPYGEKVNEVCPMPCDDPADYEDIGYTGHEYDAETGLTYMQARYYDPVGGRFYSIDPVGFDPNQPMTFNRYSYANNNPYKYVDPDGEDVVFAVNPTRAGGHGHTTLYFQDKKGNWHAYNQGAAGNTKSSGNLGFVSGQDAKAGVSIEPVSSKNIPSDGLRIDTTSKQDAMIATSAVESANAHNSGSVDYNLYSNNCTDAAVDVVNKSGTGITVSNPATTVKPNSWIEEVKKNPEAVKIEEVKQ